MKKVFTFVSLLVAAILLLTSCAPAATPTEVAVVTEVPVVATEPPVVVGTEENPITMLFVPSVDAETINTGADLIVAYMEETTGLKFEASVPTSYAATIEEMCASPANTMGFIPGLGYVLANELCGVEVSAKAIRYGLDWYAGMIYVQRDSPIQTLADLNGMKWALGDLASTSAYLYPLLMLNEAGAQAGEIINAGSHDAAILAVYNGEADFGTMFYSPPLVDGATLGLASLDSPDVPEELVASCANTAEDKDIACGNWIVKDGRRNLRKTVTDAVQKLRILAVTVPFPNDTLSYGPDFPADVKEQLNQALYDWAANDPEGFAEAFSFYSWTGVNPATDAEYDPIRSAVQNAGFKLESLGE
jgi:phosphonate transport system substrate-binding protein